ncbi:MAG: hypothetical protein ACPGUC_05815, partial [Gammaproteobacteria bacterium]
MDMQPSAPADDETDGLAGAVKDRFGIDIPRRDRVRLRAWRDRHRHLSVESLVRRIAEGDWRTDPVLGALIDTITVGESSFMRDRGQL